VERGTDAPGWDPANPIKGRGKNNPDEEPQNENKKKRTQQQTDHMQQTRRGTREKNPRSLLYWLSGLNRKETESTNPEVTPPLQRP